MIEKTLEFIKEQLGLELKLCEDFPGVCVLSNKKYFNIVLDERIPESKVYRKLKSYEELHGNIHFEPNGLNRVAVFPEY